MSEEYEENKNKKMDVTVTVDRSFELEALREEKDAKIDELESALEIIADKEFKAKCKKYGLDPANTSVEELKAKQEEGSTAPLNNYQINDSQNEEGFSSIEQGILVLSDESKTNPEIKKALDKTAKRALKSGFDYEFQGSLKDWRKPIIDKDNHETKENYEKRLIKHRLEMGKWKKKE